MAAPAMDAGIAQLRGTEELQRLEERRQQIHHQRVQLQERINAKIAAEIQMGKWRRWTVEYYRRQLRERQKQWEQRNSQVMAEFERVRTLGNQLAVTRDFSELTRSKARYTEYVRQVFPSLYEDYRQQMLSRHPQQPPRHGTAPPQRHTGLTLRGATLTPETPGPASPGRWAHGVAASGAGGLRGNSPAQSGSRPLHLGESLGAGRSSIANTVSPTEPTPSVVVGGSTASSPQHLEYSGSMLATPGRKRDSTLSLASEPAFAHEDRAASQTPSQRRDDASVFGTPQRRASMMSTPDEFFRDAHSPSKHELGFASPDQRQRRSSHLSDRQAVQPTDELVHILEQLIAAVDGMRAEHASDLYLEPRADVNIHEITSMAARGQGLEGVPCDVLCHVLCLHLQTVSQAIGMISRDFVATCLQAATNHVIAERNLTAHLNPVSLRVWKMLMRHACNVAEVRVLRPSQLSRLFASWLVPLSLSDNTREAVVARVQEIMENMLPIQEEDYLEHPNGYSSASESTLGSSVGGTPTHVAAADSYVPSFDRMSRPTAGGGSFDDSLPSGSQPGPRPSGTGYLRESLELSLGADPPSHSWSRPATAAAGTGRLASPAQPGSPFGQGRATTAPGTAAHAVAKLINSDSDSEGAGDPRRRLQQYASSKGNRRDSFEDDDSDEELMLP